MAGRNERSPGATPNELLQAGISGGLTEQRVRELDRSETGVSGQRCGCGRGLGSPHEKLAPRLALRLRGASALPATRRLGDPAAPVIGGSAMRWLGPARFVESAARRLGGLALPCFLASAARWVAA